MCQAVPRLPTLHGIVRGAWLTESVLVGAGVVAGSGSAPISLEFDVLRDLFMGENFGLREVRFQVRLAQLSLQPCDLCVGVRLSSRKGRVSPPLCG